MAKTPGGTRARKTQEQIEHNAALRKERAERKKREAESAGVRRERAKEFAKDAFFVGVGDVPGIDCGIISNFDIMLRASNLKKHIRIGDMLLLDCSDKLTRDTACVLHRDGKLTIGIVEDAEKNLFTDMCNIEDEDVYSADMADILGTIVYIIPKFQNA